MTEDSGSSTRALLQSYVDKIANAQTSVQELQREISRLRQDARADKFNMEAVSQLGQIVSKSPHDNGVGLLTDILSYAQEIGIELDTVVAQGDSLHSEQDLLERGERSDVSYFTATNILFDERLALVIQITLGLLVAGSFIWLLH